MGCGERWVLLAGAAAGLMAVAPGAPAAPAAAPAPAAPAPPIDLAAARAMFAEDQAVSDRDGGRLWGVRVYGPTFFVDPESRYTVANRPDPEGVLHAEGGLWVGTLPRSVIVSNAPTQWEGLGWTMLMWPTLPEDPVAREVMFGHESFHRVQPGLGLAAPDTPCLHLDTLEGRVWLQLEWRALAAALASRGAAQDRAIADALLFRAHRRALFEGSGPLENGQEIAEGVAEYTGAVLGEPDLASARWRAIQKLTDPDLADSFVRTFAYVSGPPYGLLLDARAPGWRAGLSVRSDLGALLGATLHRATGEDVEARAAVYGAAAVRRSEDAREVRAKAQAAAWRARLVEGPTLTARAAGHFAFSFRPGSLISLGAAGTVYPTFHVVSGWGTLDVTDGALVPTDFSQVAVAAPADGQGRHGPHVVGPGWTLDLAPGWTIAPGARPGDRVLKGP